MITCPADSGARLPRAWAAEDMNGVINYSSGMALDETLEINHVITEWRWAFRRGDTFRLIEKDREITALVSHSPELAAEVEDHKWREKPGEQLLTPAPLSSLRDALAKGWKFRVHGQKFTGVETNGALKTAYLVMLLSPRGTVYEGESPDRDTAFREALKNAAIDF